jgi:hypothetical protein
VHSRVQGSGTWCCGRCHGTRRQLARIFHQVALLCPATPHECSLCWLRVPNPICTERYAPDCAVLRHAGCVVPPCGHEPAASSRLASAPHHSPLGRVPGEISGLGLRTGEQKPSSFGPRRRCLHREPQPFIRGRGRIPKIRHRPRGRLTAPPDPARFLPPNSRSNCAQPPELAGSGCRGVGRQRVDEHGESLARGQIAGITHRNVFVMTTRWFSRLEIEQRSALARMFHQGRARVGGAAVRWQDVTTLRARAREEEQRSQRAAAPLNRVRSARYKLDLALEAKKVSIHAVLRDIRERPGEISGLARCQKHGRLFHPIGHQGLDVFNASIDFAFVVE